MNFTKIKCQRVIYGLSITTLSAIAIAIAISLIADQYPWFVLPEIIVEINQAPRNATHFLLTVLLVLVLAVLGSMMLARDVLGVGQNRVDFDMGIQDMIDVLDILMTRDRQGLFVCHAQYDSVSERLKYLINSPELSQMRHDVLQAAAKLSVVMQPVSLRYNAFEQQQLLDELTLRNRDAHTTSETLEHALTLAYELRSLSDAAELTEAGNASRISAINGILDQVNSPSAPTSPEGPPARVFEISERRK